MTFPARWRAVWITGASSGIGLELLQRFAAKGIAVAATARSAAKLEALAQRYPSVSAFPADVTDADAMEACVKEIEARLGPIDLAILSAGVFRPGSSAALTRKEYYDSLDANYRGCLNGFLALRGPMLARHEGQIAFLSSVAGYRGLPHQSAYGPTKAALTNLAEALRAELEPEGVFVSSINPGFIDTPMTANNPRHMPYIVSVEEAADRILAGLAKRKFEIVFPFRIKLYMKLLRRAPNVLYFPIARMIEASQAAGAQESSRRDDE